MRIAVSGAHGTGKSTLVSALARELPTYELLNEPYHAMVEEGHIFGYPPSHEDFEQLLGCSLTEFAQPLPRDILFDRCPIDYLAYLACLSRPKDLHLRRWIPEVSEAIARLDLMVYVPIEQPERIHVGPDEGKSMRRRVDGIIRDMVVEDGWGFGLPFIEVHGSPDERREQVITHVLFGSSSYAE